MEYGAEEHNWVEEDGTCPESLADKARLFLLNRKLKLEANAAARVAEEQRSLRATPEINRNSARIAARNVSRGGDVAMLLHADAELQRIKRENAIEQHYASTMYTTPAITARGASVVREGRVEDRLNAASNANKHNNCNHINNNITSSMQMTLASEPVHKPVIKSSDDASVNHAHSLYDLALAKKRRQEAIVRQKELSLRKGANPSLSERTRKLAAELGPSKERLLKKKLENSSIGTAEMPFKPSINPNSVKILNNIAHSEQKNDNLNAHDRLYQEHSSRTTRRAKMATASSQTREQRDLEHCTFKPSITRLAKHYQHKKDAARAAAEDQVDVTKRLAEWEKARSKRLEIQRQNKESQFLGDEYTFHPQINNRRKSVEHGNKPVKLDAGVDAHLERQRRGREEKLRKENAANGISSGKWTGRLTIPVAPKLGTAARLDAKPSRETVIGSNKNPSTNKSVMPAAIKPKPTTEMVYTQNAMGVMMSPPPPPPPPLLKGVVTKIPQRAPPPLPMSLPLQLEESFDARIETTYRLANMKKFPLDKELDEVLSQRDLEQVLNNNNNNDRSSPQRSPEEVLQNFTVLNSLLA